MPSIILEGYDSASTPTKAELIVLLDVDTVTVEIQKAILDKISQRYGQ